MKKSFEQYEKTFFKYKKIYDEGGMSNQQYIKHLTKYENACKMKIENKLV